MINANDDVKFSNFSNSEQINEHKAGVRHQSPEKETGGVLRHILVIENVGMFNVAFLRVNGCHSDHLDSRAEISTGWNVFIYFH